MIFHSINRPNELFDIVEYFEGMAEVRQEHHGGDGGGNSAESFYGFPTRSPPGPTAVENPIIEGAPTFTLPHIPFVYLLPIPISRSSRRGTYVTSILLRKFRSIPNFGGLFHSVSYLLLFVVFRRASVDDKKRLV